MRRDAADWLRAEAGEPVATEIERVQAALAKQRMPTHAALAPQR